MLINNSSFESFFSRPAVVSEKTIPSTPVSMSVRPFQHASTSRSCFQTEICISLSRALSLIKEKQKQRSKVITATTMAIVRFCRREGDVSSMEHSDQMRRTTTRKMKHSMDSNLSIASVELDSREDRVACWTTRREQGANTHYIIATH